MNYNGGLSQYTNAPSGASFGMVLELRGSTVSSLAGQLAWDVNHGSTSDVTRYLWWRASDSPNGFKYGKWHQIAFTDSNVASATKLATARTIWGQSFDGTGNVTGALSGVTNINSALYINPSGYVGIGTTSPAYTLDVTGTGRFTGAVTMSNELFLGNNKGIYFKNTSGTNVLAMYVSPSNVLQVGYNNVDSVAFQKPVTMSSILYGTHGNFSASVTATTSVVTPLLQASGGLGIVANGSAAGSRLFLTSNCFRPWGDDSKLIDLGSSSFQWRNLYAVGATFSGDVTINGNLIVKGDTSSGGTAEDTSGNGETMKVFSEALLQTVNGTTKELENGMYSYRITAAAGLNFLNVKPADTSKPCVIHLVKGGSYSLTIPVESTSGCVVTSAAGAKSTTPTVIPQYKGVTLVWDTYNKVWNVVYHGLI